MSAGPEQATGAAPSPRELRRRLGAVTLRDADRLRRRLDRVSAGDTRGLARLAGDLDAAQARLERRKESVPKDFHYPEQLPVVGRRDDLLTAIRDHQVVVVAGETGSGKTTQLPKLCLELGRGVKGAIAHTQPRRLAARTVAERIADELKTPLGGTVGYSVRFNDRSGQDTLVRLLTDGLLLAEVQHDRLLRRYDTIIVDEAHERSLNIDFLLGYLRELLPKRPDLKLIITSATIDPGRFAAHFAEAPVVEVSGRTFPVEVRYRPVLDPEDPEADPDRDQTDAIGDAVEELLAEGDGDILTFLSGEREIRDTAEVLEGRFGQRVEVLPLYARLSTAEQQRVFQEHGGRRVVLSTNVAETSLTVPGIRYVIDPGTARISRYSARLKVQRLPIEAISQASANQRKGRCGRVADGICVRLYAEEDFDARPAYTDPEVLRTSLAAVILQMTALGLADIEAFGFLDPPDRRQVRDGVNLLIELGALTEDRRLTDQGRKLAQLPVDPRLARMVLEADRLSCAEEVVVLAAALSIQDPRERPLEKQAQADQLHARFADEHSDFTAWLNLWRYLSDTREELSGNQFRKRCKAEYLHYLRVREWQDLAGQLRGAAKSVGITLNEKPGTPAQVHQALLSGLLSQIGLKDPGRREFQGPRGARFQIFPGSTLARRPPTWVMVAELVETTRLWGRTAAQIQPNWVEPLAQHLTKKTWSEPRWDPVRGSVVATERVTLYGLPIVAGRTVDYGRIDPSVSRQEFLRRALVERQWEPRHAFWEENERMLAEVERMEDRLRRRDLVVDDQRLYAWWDARIPASVVSGAHFDRWWREQRFQQPDLLTYTLADLIRPEAAEALGPTGRPRQWKQGENVLDLSYRFAPGADDDGVTVQVPLRLLGGLDGAGFEWLVPALRTELVTTLLRGLPKEHRRTLIPVGEVADQALAAMKPRREPLPRALADQLQRMRNVRVDPAELDLGALPEHLRMRFEVVGEDGAVLTAGRDLDALKAQLAPSLQATLREATAGYVRTGLTGWPADLPKVPKALALPGTGRAVRAYPALVDEGATVGVGVFEGRAPQRAAMALGTRRLLLLGVPPPGKALRGGLDTSAQLTLAAAPHGSLQALLDDVTAAAVDHLVGRAGGPAWAAEAFGALRETVRAELPETARRTLKATLKVLDAARELERALDEMGVRPELQPARQDVARQLGGLVFPGFVTPTSAARLGDVRRYLQAATHRLARLPTTVAADRDRMAAIHALEDEARGSADPEVPWLLQELRVTQFAQGLGTGGAGPVSAKRIRKALAAATA